MNRVAQLEEALKLALEYWAHRQQRYKNRHPQWVQKARAALAERQPEAAPEGWRQRAEQIIDQEKRFAEQDDKNDINIFALRLARIHTAEQILGKKPITASAPTPASAVGGTE